MNSKAMALGAALLIAVSGSALSQGPGGTSEPRGLRVRCDGAGPGYTLFAPMTSDTTYLVDVDGRVVRSWRSSFLPSAWVYLLPNGNVARGASDPGLAPQRGNGGHGGRFQEFDFDGNLVWDFRFNEGRLPHHDVAVLPNGNILAIVWDSKTAEEARRAGRRPESVPQAGVWPDMLIEFEPQRPDGARIVWEWRMWDHLIQDTDPALDNYGDPALHPERIDINAGTGGAGLAPADLFHTNAVSYNPELDQILLSVPTFNEVWVIDHSVTTQQAAGGAGGRSGKGGDLLYRWGNPEAYGRGASADRMLGFQHDARWIPAGRPGAGHMTVFNNRTPEISGSFSSVYEFIPPADPNGRYDLPASAPFGPAAPVWMYSGPPGFQATNLSGAERLENGNTLITVGPQGRIFEVTPAGGIVWEYWDPYSAGGNSFAVFKAHKLRPDHPGLAGRDLRPLNPQPATNGAASTGTGGTVGPCPSVIPPPALTGIAPGVVARGTGLPIDVTVTGTNLSSGLTLEFGPGITVSDVQSQGATKVTAKVMVLSQAALGPRPVTVSTAGGTSAAVMLNVAEPFPDLSITSSPAGTFAAGFDQTYIVTVTNHGSAPATGAIAVTDVLPAGMTFVSATGTDWTCSAADQRVNCAYAEELPNGNAASYAVTVAVRPEASSAQHSLLVIADGDLNGADDGVLDFIPVVTPAPVARVTPFPLAPGQQAGVAVTVATPLPYEVSGTVTLSFDSRAAIPGDDPAIRFSTGGRTETFVIRANETAARFGASQAPGPLAFQTGTVAGALTLGGNFIAGTASGPLSFPSSEGSSMIPLQAPVIKSVQASAQGGLAVSVLLLSTPREVTEVTLAFDTKPKAHLSCGANAGCSAAGNTLTLDVRPLFTQWFTAQSAFGGLATLRLPFGIEGGTLSGSVAVSLRNSHGVSNTVSFPLP